MDIIRFTIERPVTVAVGVILVCLFGTLALTQIPIQLTPDVDQPTVTVTTRWPGKSAREVEREIIDRQEEKLKGISDLRKMTSTATEGIAEVTLEFYVGTDRDRSLWDVEEKINQVTGYPDQVERPEIQAADAALENPIAWILFRSEQGEDVATLRDFVWDEVKPILERAQGLSSVDVFGGRREEVQVRIDPALLAARGLTLREVESALRKENVDISAGTVSKGKRDHDYRAVGKYYELDQVKETVVAYRDGGPVRVGDIADVVHTYEEPDGLVRAKGNPVLALPAYRQTGANVIEVMRELRQQIDRVNNEVLHGRGLSLELTQVYDETVYINSAIGVVRKNLVIGGVLAVVVLMLFLRSPSATGIVTVSIPISVIGTFLAVTLLGRNLNVVMLAGMAFAVGMVVDNAVVVLENIFRHRQMGKSSYQAALDGANEVWGAILASTLTTMSVFIPVIFIKEEAGQLFRDIAIAISSGVALSLVVSVMVIPTLSARVLGSGKKSKKQADKLAQQDQGGRFSTAIADFVTWINRSVLLRLAVIAFFLVGSFVGSWLLMPPSDYLPSGNRNLVFGFVITEPGLTVSEFETIGKQIEDYLRPYWSVEAGTPEAAQLPPVQMSLGPGAPPIEVQPAPIEDFFFGTFRTRCFMGATSQDDEVVKPLTDIMTAAAMSSTRAVGSIPFFFQTSLFGDVGGSNTVEVEIRADNIAEVERAAGTMLKAMNQIEEVASIRPDPMNFDLGRPEVRIVPDRMRAADVGLNVSDIGFILSAAVDGAYVGEYNNAGDKIDLIVLLQNADGSEVGPVENVPVYTPTGHVVPFRSVVEFEPVNAPQQINHIEEMPGIRLDVSPKPGIAIETMLKKVEGVVEGLRASNAISPAVLVSYAGNADKLQQTRAAMFGNWTGFNWQSVLALVQSRGFLALLVVYLLMSSLFESFIHPIAILLTVPLAMVGGFAGLRVIHMLSLMNPVAPIQQLDVVTMLGFVILLGIVVNNAILIVHQTLNNLKAGLDPTQALHESVRTRIRPILMTAMTSVGGMAPLALMTGAGSELYRGLAAVMVGGLLVSTVFTIILVPVVYSMVLSFRIWLMKTLGRETGIPTREAVAAPAPATAARETVAASTEEVPVGAGKND